MLSLVALHKHAKSSSHYDEFAYFTMKRQQFSSFNLPELAVNWIGFKRLVQTEPL